MVIVCGIDGSATSREAARAAAALAKLRRDRLTLVYVQEALVLGVEPIAGATPVALANTTYLDADRERMKVELEREAVRLRETFGIEVEISIRTGLPDHELSRVAVEREAALLVVASLGRRSPSMWRFGSVADRLSQSSPVPLLVVRDPRPFERWALGAGAGARPALSIVLALGLGKPTRVALEAVKGLTALGSCALSEVHVYDPFEEARRRGLGDAESPEARGQIEAALARELPPRPGQAGRPESERFVAVPAHGQVAETLAEFVEAERADLLVLGAHRHGALQRRFSGSVSYGVLPMVDTNVLVVPPKAVAAAPARVPERVQRALVATDLSETGNRAVELVLALLPEGCQLVLLHVNAQLELPSGWIMGYPPIVQPTPGERRLKRSLAEGELEKLARSAGARALETQIEVVESSDVAGSILAAAERHEVDLVCLGTHHHGRVASALIGSVARSVARRSPRPVLLVPTGGE